MLLMLLMMKMIILRTLVKQVVLQISSWAIASLVVDGVLRAIHAHQRRFLICGKCLLHNQLYDTISQNHSNTYDIHVENILYFITNYMLSIYKLLPLAY